jgi:methylglutaconyl-CoA hydratase
MTEPVVRLVTDERGVARITIARAEKRNAFDAQVVAEMLSALGRLDLSSRLVVLASEGTAFCAGADLVWMKSMVDYGLAENIEDSRALAQMFRALDELPMPVLARVQGPAIGGGAGLVAVADIAVASTDAVFSFSEVRLGIIPAVVSPYVVRKIGAAHATALFVGGVQFDARRAHEIGLVESIAPPEQLDARVDGYVEAVLAGGPHAVNAAKRLVREVSGGSVAQVRDLTVERIAKLRVSPEGQEGMRAFLERRKPRWPA